MDHISKSEQETYEIAQKIAENAKGGDIFLLYGDLGSGKTAFSRGFARALGVKKTVTSPTFVIMKQYPVVAHPSIHKLIHVDCYRLESCQDIESIGLDEFFKNKEAVILLEWPEKIEKSLPNNYKTIRFEYINSTSRKISS